MADVQVKHIHSVVDGLDFLHLISCPRIERSVEGERRGGGREEGRRERGREEGERKGRKERVGMKEGLDSGVRLLPSALPSAATPPQTGQSFPVTLLSQSWCSAAHSPPPQCGHPPEASPADALTRTRDRHTAWHGTWTQKGRWINPFHANLLPYKVPLRSTGI